MSTKTRDRRIDARSDAETHALVNQAADLVGESVSTFVLTAARERAERLVARADRTLMPAKQFDEMLLALDSALPNEKLRASLVRPSRIAV